ncbi:MAG: metallophosphoesterase family protein [Candidatus Woesearchaeota archaeon]
MKVLVLGDTHGITDFSYLYSLAGDVSLVVHIGDITDFGRGMRSCLAGLEQLGVVLGVPVVLTHGNHETSALIDAVRSFTNLVYVHKDVFSLGDVSVVGFGGGGFARNEPAVEEFFTRVYENELSSIHIWLFHGPPFDSAVDFHPFHGPTGSHTKRSLIDRFKPHFVFAGHIHESWGVVYELDGTVLVNPGPDGVLVDITQK